MDLPSLSAGEIAAAAAAGKGVLEMLKQAKELVFKKPDGKLVELQAQLNEMQVSIGELLGSLVVAQQERLLLLEQVQKLKAQTDLASDMDFELNGGFYVRKSDLEAKKYIPYCPLCWGSDHKVVPLGALSGPGSYMCALHRVSYSTQEHSQWEAEQRAIADARPPVSYW
jgi:hypothetical protein